MELILVRIFKAWLSPVPVTVCPPAMLQGMHATIAETKRVDKLRVVGKTPCEARALVISPLRPGPQCVTIAPAMRIKGATLTSVGVEQCL